jgi:hypothetical protein
MKVVVHDKPDARATWATHGTDGFYVGPARQHYRCWRCYMPETRAIRITDTIAWLPLGHTMPGHSHLEAFTAAVTNLATAVRHMTSSICSAPLSTSQPLRLQLLSPLKGRPLLHPQWQLKGCPHLQLKG